MGEFLKHPNAEDNRSDNLEEISGKGFPVAPEKKSNETFQRLKKGALMLAAAFMVSLPKVEANTSAVSSASAPETSTVKTEQVTNEARPFSSQEILQSPERISACVNLAQSLSGDELKNKPLDDISQYYFEKALGGNIAGYDVLHAPELISILEVIAFEHGALLESFNTYLQFERAFSKTKFQKEDISFTVKTEKDAEVIYNAMHNAKMPQDAIEYIFENGISLENLKEIQLRKNEVMDKITELKDAVERISFAIEFEDVQFPDDYKGILPLFDPRDSTEVFNALSLLNTTARSPLLRAIIEQPANYRANWVGPTESYFDTGHFDIVDMSGKVVIKGEVIAGSMLQLYIHGKPFGEPIRLPRYEIRSFRNQPQEFTREVPSEARRSWWKQVLGSIHLGIQVNAGVTVAIQSGVGVGRGDWEQSPAQWQQQQIGRESDADRYVRKKNGKVWDGMADASKEEREISKIKKKELNDGKKFAHNVEKASEGGGRPTKSQYRQGFSQASNFDHQGNNASPNTYRPK